jgi:hypothetical protein
VIAHYSGIPDNWQLWLGFLGMSITVAFSPGAGGYSVDGVGGATACSKRTGASPVKIWNSASNRRQWRRDTGEHRGKHRRRRGGVVSDHPNEHTGGGQLRGRCHRHRTNQPTGHLPPPLFVCLRNYL